MTAERLLGAVGDIRDEYVREADAKPTSGKRFSWVKWLAIAACLAAAVLIVAPWVGIVFGGSTGSVRNVLSGANAVPHYNTFSTYEELATEYADPVLEALAASDEAQGHSVEYATMRVRNGEELGRIMIVFAVIDSPEKIDREYTADEISLDRAGVLIGTAPTAILLYPDGSLDKDFDFSDAARYDVRSDYVVDGVEIQKYYEKDSSVRSLEEQIANLDSDEAEYIDEYIDELERVKAWDEYVFWERVAINGRRYYVRSNDEATADAVATALAHIAAGN